jgi:reverse gyrase
MIKSILLRLCPNCGGNISADRLLKGLPCNVCMPDEEKPLCSALKEGELKKLCHVEEQLKEWEEVFERHIKSKPWSLQFAWAKRVFLGSSFALLAPTGVGKTSFGLSMAFYLAKKGKKSYIILPTKLLVNEVSKRLKRMRIKDSALLTFGDEEGKKKEEKKERLVKGDFLILVSTSMFLYRNYQLIPKDMSFVFVDDVDSFLKTAKNVDKALYLLGFSEEDIEKAMSLIRLKEKFKKTQEDWERIKELSQEVRELSEKVKGVLVVSSATSNPRSSRIKLFRELLGFEVGTPTFYLRNIVDAYAPYQEQDLSKWIRKLGKGGLVFLSSDKGKDEVYALVKSLEEKGIKAVSYEDLDEKHLSDYEKGKIDVIVGIASYRNPLARGFDMPHVVRYALFYGVPKMVISLSFEKSLSHLLWALSSVRYHIAKHLSQHIQKVDSWISKLKRYQYINEDYLKEKRDLKERIQQLREEIRQFLMSQEVINIIETSEDLTLRLVNGDYQMVVSDATGYLQASGRTSRMFAGGITKGLSLLLVDDQRAFNHLKKRVRWFSEDIDFVSISSVDLENILLQIDTDRAKVKNFLRGEKAPTQTDLLKPVLIVVESPNKAKTIANFFGKVVRRRIGQHEVLETSLEDRYLMITSSLGHVLDLNKEEGFHGVYVNEEIVPVYESIEGKEELVKSIRRMSLEAMQVLIATDPDTEGEKIGWDLMELLKPYVKDIKRMEFHEVTKKAIVKAIKEPRDFNTNLVKAQVVRRVADRWVGFEFSRFLQQAFGKSWLSAGRVQTPVLGWIIDREKEYRKRIYKVFIRIEKDGKTFKTEFSFENKDAAKEFYDRLKYLEFRVLESKEEYRNPPPPYTTDSLLKDASDRYKFSLPKTMSLAQTLFELGFITYHRTDSSRVSDYGISVAKEYIKEELGEDYFKPNRFAEGGAHECIRPTKPMDTEELRSFLLSDQAENLTREHLMLYDLIFRRFMASQTRPVKVRSLEVLVKAGEFEQKHTLTVEVLEEGWNRFLYLETHPHIEGKVPAEGIKELKELPKAFLYTHGELVQEMKKRGIGRPSTYATIVEKLLERGYVIERKGFLIPTKLGKSAYEYLSKREGIREFVSEEFTKKLEGLMDMVEEGSADYENILKDLYRVIMSLELLLEVGR